MIAWDIVALLVLAAASGAGIGGGGLLVVYLTQLRGMAQVPSQALNLAFFILSALSSAAVQKKHGTLPDLKATAFCSAAAIPGVLLGTHLRGMMTGDGLRTAFGVLLLITGGAVMWKEIRGKMAGRKTK